MFRVFRLRDVVRVDPARMDKPLEEVVFEELRKKYEGLKDRTLGIIIAVTDINVDPMGYIPIGDGAPYHVTEFTVLSYVPIVNEVVEGTVETVGRSGITVNIGPIEGFVHIQQIADDEVSYEIARNIIMCKNTKKFVAHGDMVRARITSVSLGTLGRPPRVNMTMRQPYLGKLDWIVKKQ
uniref:DNA-directed RNA polymerase subunit Rpo7 n=1 Tax=Ignisphaera aggregans TaxID=334771 RepID=A0A7J2U4Z4_9CREN